MCWLTCKPAQGDAAAAGHSNLDLLRLITSDGLGQLAQWNVKRCKGWFCDADLRSRCLGSCQAQQRSKGDMAKLRDTSVFIVRAGFAAVPTSDQSMT